jgi:hypothetical protein
MCGDRYLLCRAGSYVVAIRMDWVRQIGVGTRAAENVDLRCLLKVSHADPGLSIALQVAMIDIVVIVDAAPQIETIADSDFRPLPGVFGEANTIFDGACRREVGGRHPLRLRLQALTSAPL